jgi:hypothetical protein
VILWFYRALQLALLAFFCNILRKGQVIYKEETDIGVHQETVLESMRLDQRVLQYSRLILHDPVD